MWCLYFSLTMNILTFWYPLMATRSSILAWRIPWKEEPGGLQPTGSQRVRQDWATSLSLFHFLYNKNQSFGYWPLCTWWEYPPGPLKWRVRLKCLNHWGSPWSSPAAKILCYVLQIRVLIVITKGTFRK